MVVGLVLYYTLLLLYVCTTVLTLITTNCASVRWKNLTGHQVMYSLLLPILLILILIPASTGKNNCFHHSSSTFYGVVNMVNVTMSNMISFITSSLLANFFT